MILLITLIIVTSDNEIDQALKLHFILIYMRRQKPGVETIGYL